MTVGDRSKAVAQTCLGSSDGRATWVGMFLLLSVAFG